MKNEITKEDLYYLFNQIEADNRRGNEVLDKIAKHIFGKGIRDVVTDVDRSILEEVEAA